MLLLCAHALHAHAGRWVTNEKGLVPAVASLPDGGSFAEDAARALADLSDLGASVEVVEQVLARTRRIIGK